jgi:YVTN family beta-propeller protein
MIKEMRITIIGLLFGLVFLASCDDKEQLFTDFPLPPKNQGVVFIGSEGNFQFGNADLTVLDKSNYALFSDVFLQANKFKLGDVLQSIYMHEQKVYLVVNNSQKIEIISPQNYVSLGSINGFTSPRYMVAKENKAFVSEYYANAIRVVDLVSKQITSTITIPGWAEEMLWLNNKLYVCNANRNQILVIDATTNALTDSITVGTEPVSITADYAGHIWVLCKGSKTKQVHPTLHKINATSGAVDLQLQAGVYDDEARELCINAAKQTLYWISKHVYAMPVAATQVPALPFVYNNKQTFYALGFDADAGELFVADAIDYVQKSMIYRYNEGGALKGQFKAGINTGHFAFYKP